MPFLNHLPELMIIMVAGLLIFGPKRLPEIGNAVSKTIKDFRKSMNEHETTSIEATGKVEHLSVTASETTRLDS